MGYQETITFILEMIGTVAFAASGALVGSEQKMDIFGVTVLGVITAVGGGMIRDVTLGIIPPGVFQKPVVCGCGSAHICAGVFPSLFQEGAAGGECNL